jgi:sulfoxide reductase catalytic subunit YedY
MLIKPAVDIPSSEITSHSTYLNRRKFMQSSGVALAAMGLASTAGALETHSGKQSKFGPDWLKQALRLL